MTGPRTCVFFFKSLIWRVSGIEYLPGEEDIEMLKILSDGTSMRPCSLYMSIIIRIVAEIGEMGRVFTQLELQTNFSLFYRPGLYGYGSIDVAIDVHMSIAIRLPIISMDINTHISKYMPKCKPIWKNCRRKQNSKSWWFQSQFLMLQFQENGL